MARFLNPYNFVRPLPKPTVPALSPETADMHLLWQCPPPPHDRYTGLSGKITCTMTAVTPVFVSDSQIVSETNGHKTYRFFNVDGVDMIPGSSLRGSIRSVFEAVTSSTWSVFGDKQLSYRENSDFARGLIPACLDYDAASATWSVKLYPGNSDIGFDEENEAKRYYAKDSTKPNRDGALYAAWVPQAMARRFNHGQICYAVMMEHTHRKGFRYFRVTGLESDKSRLPVGSTPILGVMCRTGEGNIGNKHDERFFFGSSGTHKYVVSPNVIHRYNAAIEERRDYYENNSSQFQYAPSRYLTNLWEMERIHADNPLLSDPTTAHFPVYVRLRLNPVTNLHEVDYLAPIAIPRVPEKATLHEVMRREGFAHLLPATNYDQLSLADRMFGWVSQNADKELERPVAYRGRLRFSHAKINGTAEICENIPLSILSAPKPTTTRFYVHWRKPNKDGVYVNATERRFGVEQESGGANPQDRPTDNDLRYGKAGNMLRGRKFYRHHSLFNADEAKIHDARRNNSDQNRTIKGTHDKGTSYTFTIDFENLQPVELGALLWVLRLKDTFVYSDDEQISFDGFHRLGYGKPLGFGSVKIDIQTLDFHHWNSRYQHSEENAGIQTIEGNDLASVMATLTQKFKKTLGILLYGKSFERLPNIIDLCTLLTEPRVGEHVSIHYPRPKHQRGNSGDNNFEWFKDNKRTGNGGGPNLILVLPSQDVDGFPHMSWNKNTRHVEITEE